VSTRIVRNVRAAIVVGVACTMLVACYPTHRALPKADELVDTWVNGDTRLVLSSDRTFTLTDAPAYVHGGEGVNWQTGTRPTWNDAGDWKLEGPHLRIRALQLDLDFVGSELVLEFPINLGSDDPRCLQLVRAESSLKPLLPQDCHIPA
jgi:hypothetical protein